MLPLNGYRVVLADPPWRFEARSEKGEAKNPVAHYPCMELPALKALGREIGLDFACAPDSVLVMWATFPMLPEALELMAAWGFRYKTGGAWGKLTQGGGIAFGTGYIYRSAAELWLVGTRGAPRLRNRSTRNLVLDDAGGILWAAHEGGFIGAERREHSRKPDRLHADIEALFDGPYLELFARQRRPGWDAWGNEVDKFGEAAA